MAPRGGVVAALMFGGLPAMLLAACDPAAGFLDFSAWHLGAEKCEDIRPLETHVDWSSWGEEPSKQTSCQQGDRDIQDVFFTNGQFWIDTLRGASLFLVDADDEFRKSLGKIPDLRSDPKDIRVRRDHGRLGPMLVAALKIAERDCVGFRINIGATGAVEGGGLGTKRMVTGTYCKDSTAAADDFENAALSRIRDLGLREK